MRRCLRLFGNAHPEQKIIEKLAHLKELQKSVKLGKRHTLRHATFKERTLRASIPSIGRPIEEFKAAKKFLVNKQTELEREFLTEIGKRLEPDEREELMQSWKQRRAVSKKANIERISSSPPKEEEEPVEEIFDLQSLLIQNRTKPTYNDIGKFLELPVDKARTLFSDGIFGEMIREQYTLNDRVDVMLREESFNLINLMRGMQNVRPDSVEVSGQGQKGFKEALETNSYAYMAVYSSLGYYINCAVTNSQNKDLRNLYRNSFDTFDLLKRVLIKELAEPDLYFKVFEEFNFHSTSELRSQLSQSKLPSLVDQLCSFLANKVPYADTLMAISARDFVEQITAQINLEGFSHTIDLKKYSDLRSLKKSPDSELGRVKGLNGVVVSGKRGSGKSQVLTAAALWAFEEGNWVVFKVPRATDLTKNATHIIWDPCGLYIHPEVAYDLLSDFKNANGEKLGQIKVDLNLYGKYNLAGMHDELDQEYQPLPAKQEWIRELQCYTDNWKQFYPRDYLEEALRGVLEYELKPRKTRFEHEIEVVDNPPVPPIIMQRLEDPEFNHQIDFEKILNLNITKRKPKKTKLPKCGSDTHQLSHKMKPIYSQELAIGHEEGPNVIENSSEILATRLKEKLPEPKTLAEIVEFGLAHHTYAQNAICEILEQLYHIDDFNVLVLVDGFNEFFKASDFHSVKYENYKECKGAIPPYDMGLCRALMRFDGHTIKNGVKIVATSEKFDPIEKRTWNIEHLNIPKAYELEVQNLTLNDYRYMVNYYKSTGWLNYNMNEIEMEGMFMQTQGNWWITHQQIHSSPPKLY